MAGVSAANECCIILIGPQNCQFMCCQSTDLIAPPIHTPTHHSGFSAEVVSAAATAAAAAATPEATQDEQAILEEPEIPTNSTGAAGNSTAQEQRPPPPPLPAFCEKYAKTFLPSIWLDLQPWSKGIKLETLSSGSRKYTMELR